MAKDAINLDRIATDAAREGLRKFASNQLWTAQMACEKARSDGMEEWAEHIDKARQALDMAESAFVRAALVTATA